MGQRERGALERFERALALGDAGRFPFDLARVRLLFGERLRRARATTEARTQLGAALDAFQLLGATPWAARAAGELRASGQAGTRARRADGDVLTAQEREVALL